MPTTLTSPPGFTPYRWYKELKQLFVLALERYRAGARDPAKFLTDAHVEYLAFIGMSPQELFDFAEDSARNGGDPDWETVLLISAVRREFLVVAQHGMVSDHRVSVDDLPAKEAQLGGIAWLPRLIQKAEAKLRGEMPPDLMYNCGGDRSFFRANHMHPADFLRLVWATRGNEEKILAYVQRAKAEGDRLFAEAAEAEEAAEAAEAAETNEPPKPDSTSETRQ